MAFANIKSVFYFYFFVWEMIYFKIILKFTFQLELVFNTLLY